MRLRASLLGSLALSVPFLTAAAHGQATENAVTEAEDAFGFRNGDESVGIYNEQSVRGFNLESAGNYRVDGSYFVKSSGVSNFFVDATTVRIGYNTLGVNLPGPSGVVDYRLRDPERGEPSLVTAGLKEYAGPYLDLQYKHRRADNAASLSLGLSLDFDIGEDQGGSKSSWLLGGVGRVNVGDTGILRLFGGEYDYERDSRFVVVTDGSFVPAEIERRRYLGQEWSRDRGQRRIAGMLYDQKIGQGWSAGLTSVFSEEDPARAYTQIFRLSEPEGLAHSTMVAAPAQRFTAWSGEGRLGYETRSDGLAHRVNLLARGRLSRNRFGGEQLVDLGDVAFGEAPEAGQAPSFAGSENTRRDRVDQWGLGLAYHLVWRDRLRLTTGLLKTHYEKRFTTPDSVSESLATPWLYNFGAAVPLGKAVEIYGSYSRGLEEAGTAPASAVNRNAVLDAILVSQRELGARYAVAPGVSLIVAGFDTRKPYAGLDVDTGIFGLVGTVRHRGVEASLSGTVAEGLSLVVGGVVTEARLESDAVAAGLVGNRPVGVPALKLIASANYSVPGLSALSIDAGLDYASKQAASARLTDGEQLEVAASMTVNMGLRYRFELGAQPATLRLQALNLFDQFRWQVSSAESLTYSPGCRFRLVLTSEF